MRVLLRIATLCLTASLLGLAMCHAQTEHATRRDPAALPASKAGPVVLPRQAQEASPRPDLAEARLDPIALPASKAGPVLMPASKAGPVFLPRPAPQPAQSVQTPTVPPQAAPR